MRFLLLSFAVALAACSGSSTPTSTPTPDPVDNAGGNAAAGECATDDDCVVSCAAPQECCDVQLCEPCQQVYTRAELAEIEAFRASSCGDASCPMAKCMAPTEQALAVCNAGQCEIKMAPLPRD